MTLFFICIILPTWRTARHPGFSALILVRSNYISVRKKKNHFQWYCYFNSESSNEKTATALGRKGRWNGGVFPARNRVNGRIDLNKSSSKHWRSWRIHTATCASTAASTPSFSISDLTGESLLSEMFASCHPPGVKYGFIKGEAIRLLTTNSSKKHMIKAFEIQITSQSKRVPRKHHRKVSGRGQLGL